MIRQKLNEIVAYLNEHFHQESKNYDIANGPKSTIVIFDNETIISTWACGAIVSINKIIYFISEDDGRWYYTETENYIGVKAYFSIYWIDSFIKALDNLKLTLNEIETV